MIIGLVDERVPPSMERYGDDDNPSLVAETPSFRVFQLRWPVVEGVTGEGLLIEPRREAAGHVVAIPDADQTPEMIAGLATGLPPEGQFARILAENGFEVVAPLLIDRAAEVSGHEDVNFTNLPHREWIYRQAFVMGRHIIGYDVQKVLSVIDWFEQRRGAARSGSRRLRGRGARSSVRRRSRHAHRRRSRQRLLLVTSARLGRAPRSDRVGALARVRRRRDCQPDRAAGSGG